MNQTSSFLLSSTLFILGIGILLIPSVAFSASGDPTASLLPSVECETPTCEEAAVAFSERNYDDAARLFAAYFDEKVAGDETAGAWLVHAAYARMQAEDWDDAADLYARAALEVAPLHDYLLTQAVRSSLKGSSDEEIFSLAMQTEALEAGFEDGYFLKAQLQTRHTGLPKAATTESALIRNDVDTVCPWLLETLVGVSAESDENEALFNLAHGHCVDDKWDNDFSNLSYAPSATARLQRANRLARAVRFNDALEQLDAIEDGALSAIDQCRAEFRRGRSHFRLRQQQSAEDIFRGVIADCTDEANEDQRVRSLYSVGNRNYQRNRLDESEHFFTTLYEEYPHRSHADDALFFLARIERSRDNPDREREKALLVEALEKYPHEDMIHEFAWEVFEPVFRRGDYAAFIDSVTALPLPSWDHEYFSQGRLEYFVGLAHQRLDDFDDAEQYWQLAWVKYPFSFYGYLAHLRLLEHDFIPEPLDNPDGAGLVHWFDDSFEGTGADILARAGHLAGACDFEASRLSTMESTRNDRWRLATLCHHAGDHPFSHNVARRQISGRPWAAPRDGRLARWHVAWPDPYADELATAIARFGPDDEALAIHPGFVSSIMREESGFNEDVVSWAGAIGLLQLMPATARDHESVIDGSATPDRLETAAINIPVGIDHMAMLSNRFDGHPVFMTAAYNAGGGRISGWLRRQPNDEIALWVEDIPIFETRNYTKRVIGSYAAYQYLQGEQTLDARIIKPAK